MEITTLTKKMWSIKSTQTHAKCKHHQTTKRIKLNIGKHRTIYNKKKQVLL